MSGNTENLNDTYPGAGTYCFGENDADSKAQLALVRAGEKSLNCEALSAFGGDENALPQVGRCDIAANWDGTPALVTKTVFIEKRRFCDVGWELAMREGIGNSLAEWRAFREEYFTRNGGFDPEMMLVFERFEVIDDMAGRELPSAKEKS
jgi:uncharacterized protein YhfF